MQWEKFIQAGVRLPYYMNLYMQGKVIDSPQISGLPCCDWFLQSENQLTSVYYNTEEIKLAEEILRKKITDLRFLIYLPQIILDTDKKLLKFCHSLSFTNFQKTSNQELLELFQKFSELFRIKFGIYSLPKIIDLATTNILSEILPTDLTKEDYICLIEYSWLSDYQKERTIHLQIVRAIKQLKLAELFQKTDNQIIEELGRFHPELYSWLEKYTKTFSWLTTSHHVQPFNLNNALAALKNSLNDETALVELDKLLNKNREVSEKQSAILKKYNFSKTHLKIIEFLRQINFANESRKASMSKALLWSYPLFQEIAKRLNTNVVSLRQLTAEEITQAFLRQKLTETDFKNIKDRLNYYVCVIKDNTLLEFNGEPAKKYFAENFKPIDKNLTEVKGNPAQKGGPVVGKARIILIEHQVEKLEPGEILITSMTDPNMVPAMKKAAAIVTDEGGITCHAAIVSRELKKPCVVGTKIATKVFHDGELLEVDANIGVVKKI